MNTSSPFSQTICELSVTAQETNPFPLCLNRFGPIPTDVYVGKFHLCGATFRVSHFKVCAGIWVLLTSRYLVLPYPSDLMVNLDCCTAVLEIQYPAKHRRSCALGKGRKGEERGVDATLKGCVAWWATIR